MVDITSNGIVLLSVEYPAHTKIPYYVIVLQKDNR